MTQMWLLGWWVGHACNFSCLHEDTAWVYWVGHEARLGGWEGGWVMLVTLLGTSRGV
jgi:hypothetical protein